MTLIMTEDQRRFPELSEILSYLNQDWEYIFNWGSTEPTFEAVVRHYKATSSLAEIKRAINDIERLLAMCATENDISESLDKLNSSYYPMGGGQTYREWLEAVLVVLHEPQEKARELRYIEGTDTGGWKEYVDEDTKRMLNIK